MFARSLGVVGGKVLLYKKESGAIQMIKMLQLPFQLTDGCHRRIKRMEGSKEDDEDEDVNASSDPLLLNYQGRYPCDVRKNLFDTTLPNCPKFM